MREIIRALRYLTLFFVLFVLAACHPSAIESAETTNIHPTRSQSLTITSTPTNAPLTQIAPSATIYPTASSTPRKTQPPIPSTDTPKGFDTPASETILGEAIDFSWDGVTEFSPDNRLVALARDRVNIWDTDTHKLQYVFRIPYDNYGATQIDFNVDTSLIAVSTRCRLDCTAQETHLMIWDLRNKKLLHDWLIPNAHMDGPHDYDYDIPVNGLSFHPEGDILAYAKGNTVEIRDLARDEEPVVIDLGPEMYATEITFSEDGRYLNVLMEWVKDHGWPYEYAVEFRVQVWGTASYLLEKDIDYAELGWFEEYLSLSGSYLFHRDDITRVYTSTNLITEEVTFLPYREGWSFVSPDHSLVLFVRGIDFETVDKGIEIWDTDRGEKLADYKFFQLGYTFDGHYSLAVSPDNALLAIADNGQLILWDISPIRKQ